MPNLPALEQLALGVAQQPPYDPLPPTLIGPTFTTQADESRYHPLVPALRAQLKPLSADQRKAVLLGWLGWLSGRQDTVRSLLRSLGMSPDLPEALSSRPQADWPIHSRRRVKVPRFRLKAGAQGGNEREPTATDHALTALSNQDFASSAYALSETSAADFLLQIRCLADVYGRWEAAGRAVQRLLPNQAASPKLTARELLARALTLFRIEGDCTLVPEADTLVATVSHPVPLPPGRSRWKANVTAEANGQTVYLLSLACATYLVDKIKQLAIDPDGAEHPFDEADKVFSWGCFGFDILWNPNYQTQAENLFPSNPPFVPDSLLLNWPSLNRSGVSPQDAYNQAEQDRQRRHTLLASQDLGDALRITTGAQAG